MREILFRGKQVANGQWAEGNLSYGKFDESKETTAFIEMGFGHGLREVRPETVGQYTGLNDMNDKRIFEGDILKDSLGWVYVVRYDDDNCRFLGYSNKPRGCTYIHYVGREPRSEIIGNIHDNPELLEE